MRHSAFLSALLFASFLYAPSALAQNAEGNKWAPHIEAEGKWGNKRNLGEVGLFIPVWQDADSLLFADFRGRFDNKDSSEGNFGIGYRQQVSEDWALGGYAFYDRRRTPNDFNYDQATIGAEAFSEDLEFRINAYIPETTENDLGSAVDIASIAGTNFQITNFSAPKERALPGFDVEAGHKFTLPQGWEAWTYIGGFHFDAEDYDTVAGPRGRVELSYKDVPVLGEGSRFTVGLEAQHDDVRDGQVFGIARLRIPLNFTGNNTSNLSALDKRMTTRIVRDIDIVSGEVAAQAESIETATVSLANGTTVSSYTTVDANDNITNEVTNAGANALVVVDGAAGTVNTATIVAAQNGQSIVGGGTTLTLTGANSGRTATITLPGSRPTINGTNGGLDPVQVFGGAHNVTIENVTITGGAVGLSINGSNNTLIKNVTVRDTGDDSLRLNTTDGVTVQDVSLIRPNAGGQETIQFEATNTNVTLNTVSMQDSNIGLLFPNIGAATTTGISISNVTIDTTASHAVQTAGGATVNNPSGSITATNIGGANCSNGGAINGSTLLINGASCP